MTGIRRPKRTLANIFIIKRDLRTKIVVMEIYNFLIQFYVPFKIVCVCVWGGGDSNRVNRDKDYRNLVYGSTVSGGPNCFIFVGKFEKILVKV